MEYPNLIETIWSLSSGFGCSPSIIDNVSWTMTTDY